MCLFGVSKRGRIIVLTWSRVLGTFALWVKMGGGREISSYNLEEEKEKRGKKKKKGPSARYCLQMRIREEMRYLGFQQADGGVPNPRG